MAASAAAAQANQRASTRRMCSARRAASLAWAAAYATAVWSANWLEWTTRKRISARRCRKGVDHSSDGSAKLIPMDKQPDNKIVHAFRLRKADRATHEPLDPGA